MREAGRPALLGVALPGNVCTGDHIPPLIKQLCGALQPALNLTQAVSTERQSKWHLLSLRNALLPDQVKHNLNKLLWVAGLLLAFLRQVLKEISR